VREITKRTHRGPVRAPFENTKRTQDLIRKKIIQKAEAEALGCKLKLAPPATIFISAVATGGKRSSPRDVTGSALIRNHGVRRQVDRHCIRRRLEHLPHLRVVQFDPHLRGIYDNAQVAVIRVVVILENQIRVDV
jgi:hypothetical protein